MTFFCKLVKAGGYDSAQLPSFHQSQKPKICPASRRVMKNSDWGGTVTYFGTCTLLSNTCPCLLVHLRIFPAACTTGELKTFLYSEREPVKQLFGDEVISATRIYNKLYRYALNFTRQKIYLWAVTVADHVCFLSRWRFYENSFRFCLITVFLESEEPGS